METAKMLVEAGLCIGEQSKNLKGGFVPPGAGLGRALLKRLLKVGVQFEITDTTLPRQES